MAKLKPYPETKSFGLRSSFKSMDEAIEAGRYDLVDSDFGTVFKIPFSSVNGKFCLMKAEQPLNFQEAVIKMSQNEVRPANIQEFLTFGARYRNGLTAIIGLGTCREENSLRYVASIRRDIVQRRLCKELLTKAGEQVAWSPDTMFLVSMLK